MNEIKRKVTEGQLESLNLLIALSSNNLSDYEKLKLDVANLKFKEEQFEQCFENLELIYKSISERYEESK